MAQHRRDDDLAYGEYNPRNDGEEGNRGVMSDMGRRLFGGRKEVSTIRFTNANAVIVHLDPVPSGLEADRGSHSAAGRFCCVWAIFLPLDSIHLTRSRSHRPTFEYTIRV